MDSTGKAYFEEIVNDLNKQDIQQENGNIKEKILMTLLISTPFCYCFSQREEGTLDKLINSGLSSDDAFSDYDCNKK